MSCVQPLFYRHWTGQLTRRRKPNGHGFPPVHDADVHTSDVQMVEHDLWLHRGADGAHPGRRKRISNSRPSGVRMTFIFAALSLGTSDSRKEQICKASARLWVLITGKKKMKGFRESTLRPQG